MKRIFERFLFCLLALCLCALPAQAQYRPIRVIVYGDSLTSGYQLQPEQSFPAKMERKLKEVGFTDVEVINMSIAGETTAGGLERLHSLLVRQPDVVVLELGANDAIRGISVDLIYNNLVTIVSKLVANKIYVVMVGMKAPPNMGYSYSGQLDATYKQISILYNNLPLYPFALEGIVGRPELNLADGYHPNAKGVEVMVENLYPYVDAGVRWKMEALRYQQEYQYEIQRQLLQGANPTAIEAAPHTPTPQAATPAPVAPAPETTPAPPPPPTATP